MGFLYLFTSVFGVHYLLSNLIGIAVATTWNYLLNSWWTWNRGVEPNRSSTT
jgi:putative flippase GtrA